MIGFDAEVRASGRGSHAVVVPKDVLADLGTRRVLARVGPEEFEVTLGAYGGRTFLGLRTSVLAAAGVAAGDTVHVELEPAAPPEEPEADPVPLTCDELERVLADDPAFAEAWGRLPDGHREEYGRWISGGADEATRRARTDRVHRRLTLRR